MRYVFALLLSAGSLTVSGVAFAQGSARALFATGEGTAISASSVPKEAAPAKRKESFSGISYKILEVAENGAETSVNGAETSVSSRKIFRSGDKIRISAKVNKSGYLRVINVGPTGNINKLFEARVNSAQRVTIPQQGAFRFAGPAGVERVFILLSNVPFESDNSTGFSACGTVKFARSRDLVIEDSMESEFSVVWRVSSRLSPRARVVLPLPRQLVILLWSLSKVPIMAWCRVRH